MLGRRPQNLQDARRNVFITNPRGGRLHFIVGPATTWRQMARAIRGRWRLPLGAFRLTFGGEAVMDFGDTLYAAGVLEGNVVVVQMAQGVAY